MALLFRGAFFMPTFALPFGTNIPPIGGVLCYKIIYLAFIFYLKAANKYRLNTRGASSGGHTPTAIFSMQKDRESRTLSVHLLREVEKGKVVVIQLTVLWAVKPAICSWHSLSMENVP